MKLVLRPRRLAVAIAACAVAGGGWAMSVGRAQGVALIGRSLDITVPVQFDLASESLPECAEADVFYGDTRIDRGRLSADIAPASSGAVVRVRSSIVLNEPVVTVYLHLGCGSRTTRRLVLLAEHPDPAAEPPRSLARVPATGTAPPGAGAARPEPRAGATSSGVVGPDRSGRGRAGERSPQVDAPRGEPPGPVATPPAQSGGRTAARKPGAAAPQARLKLEPLDLSAPLEPTLRLSDGMATPGEGTPQQRAAAVALWRALNAQPEDLLRDAQRLQSLESDLRSLRQSVQRNDAALADLRSQLQKARTQRFANPLVYLLALLALAAIAAAAWAWRRAAQARRSGPWWGAPDAGADSDFATATAVPTQTPPVTQPPRERPGAPALDLDLDVPAPAPERAAAPVLTEPAPIQAFRPSQQPDFQASHGSTLRSLRAEELHDVQQEADFFFSLGEYERAIDVLRAHIAAHPGTSAVAWLDLMEIFHRLDRRAEFENVRAGFQRAFNAQVPEFDAYRDESLGLEAYENAMARIVALWPSRRVLEVIEESIFREPAQDGAPAFSLQAYRELLLLHHIGTEVFGATEKAAFADGAAPDSRSGFGASAFRDSLGGPRADFAHTSIHPLSAAAAETRPASIYPEIGLDLNLDDLPPANEASMDSGRPPAAPADSHLLDFDLPDVDLSAFKPKKTGE
ncbi:MAG TPA: hypothetical protein VFE82_12190 [Ramlibacter sp.]|jgi:hypothetical protein|uniref:hypothetical protein n=1 Tax=Ramlibacter sp. TaxID=1917967 RepID=UPI002D324BBF|nr:hypothetical protein [Ramlibacter sp.]HZY19232.1 hypothetical protein [Ramlibacter sp.]